MKYILTIAILICPLVAIGQSWTSIDAFEAFSDTFFTVGQDSLYLDHFGTSFEFGDSTWTDAGRNRFSVWTTTTHDADLFVAYGTTDSYGDTVSGDGNRYWTHLRIIPGLTASTEYHYKIVAVSAAGDTITTDDATFTTVSGSGWTEVTGTPPHTLDSASTTYYLSSDVTADTRAFTISASGITLDLNGYTVSYDNDTPDVADGSSWDSFYYSSTATFGVRVGSSSVTITGGYIVQGSYGGQSSANAIGFNPILSSAASTAIQGVDITYYGDQVSGIYLRGTPGGDVYYTSISDTGTVIDNRHQGVAAAEGDNGIGYYGVLVKRARQQGLMSSSGAEKCEVRADSWATNSFSIAPQRNSVTYDNILMGTGYHNVGGGWALIDDCDSLVVRKNFVHVVAQEPSNRSDEYSTHASANGMRLTQYSGSSYNYNNYLYEYNTILAQGRDAPDQLRGTQFFSGAYVSNLRFRHNTVKVDMLDDSAPTFGGCVHLHGGSNTPALPVLYSDNTFITDLRHITSNDNYAGGGHHRFVDNIFRKIEDRADYNTIKLGYWVYDSPGNELFDNYFWGGAGPEDNNFDNANSEAENSYYYGHTSWFRLEDGNGVLANEPVTMTTAQGYSYTDTTDAGGLVRLDLCDWDYTEPAGSTTESKTDHNGWMIHFNSDSVAVSDADTAVSNTSLTPLVYTIAGSGGQVSEFSVSSATRTDGNAVLAWSDTGADSYQVQIDASGVTIYHATTTGTTITIPDVDLGALDVTVWPITSGEQGTPARTQIAAQ